MDKAVEGELLTPLPRNQEISITMSFLDAMREVIIGKKVRRMLWEIKLDYVFVKDGWLTIYTKDKFHTWIINDGDLEGEDWYVIREEN